VDRKSPPGHMFYYLAATYKIFLKKIRSIEKCIMKKKIPHHIKLAIHVWSTKFR
jgi:hypothetical protein